MAKTSSDTNAALDTKTSLDRSKIKFLLLEGVSQTAIDTLRNAGYTNIDYHKKALADAELKQAIQHAHFVGIRSRTQLTREVFAAAEKLIAVGCFCIGTNQVDLRAAIEHGVPNKKQTQWQRQGCRLSRNGIPIQVRTQKYERLKKNQSRHGCKKT